MAEHRKSLSRFNFNDHCLLCLQPQPPDKVKEVVRRNPKKLKSVRPVIHYLTGTDPSYDDETGEEEEGEDLDLPPLCRACYEITAELYRLHEQLLETMRLIQQQTEVARKVVTKSILPNPPQPSPRSQFHERVWACGMSGGEAAQVTKFVANLHAKIQAEATGNKNVCFASRIPSGFLPPAVKLPDHSHSQPQPQSTKAATVSPVTRSISNSQGSTPRKAVTNEEDVDTEEPEPDSYADDDIEEVDEFEMKSEPHSPEDSSAESENEDDEEIAIAKPTPAKPNRTITTSSTSNSKLKPNQTPQVTPATKPSVTRRGPGKDLCSLCGVWLPTASMLEHMKSHVQDYVTPCLNPACPKVFPCSRHMERHIVGRSPDCRMAVNFQKGSSFTKICETCNFTTDVAPTFLCHLHEHELALPEKSFPCPIPGCSERYALRQSVDKHLYTHDLRPQRPEQECPVCKELLKTQELAQHFKDAHQVEKVIPCKRCPLQFPSWELLLDHLSQHRSVGQTCECDLCDGDDKVKFFKFNSLRQHYFNVHQVGKQFICEHCDRIFYAQSTLSAHLKTKHSPSAGVQTEAKGSSFKCDLCPDSFRSPYKLRLHKFSVHGVGEDPLLCRFCKKTFPSVYKVKLHEAEHGGLAVKNYKCPVAGCCKEYRKLEEFSDHKLSHSNSREFVCDQCGKGYNHPRALRRHKTQVHLGKGKRPSMCDICGETFSSKPGLQKHKLVHTRERPFSCPECGQAFRQHGPMKRHLRSHQQKGADFKPQGPWKQDVLDRNKKRTQPEEEPDSS